MKTATLSLITVLIAVAAFMGGCSLFVPGYEKAKEAYEASSGAYSAALVDLEKLGVEVKEVAKNYELAIIEGDATKAEALKQALTEAVSRYKTAEDSARTLKAAFDVSVAQFEKAESSADYIGTVIGLVGSAFTGLFGFGAGSVKSKRVGTEAASATTAAIDKLKAGKPWEAVRDSMLASLTPAAKKLIDNVRP